MELRRYGLSLFLCLGIPILAAVATWATGILVSYSPGSLGARTPSYGFPLSWISVGYLPGCELATPYCFIYSVDWLSLSLDMLLYLLSTLAVTMTCFRVAGRQFPSPLDRELDWTTLRAIIVMVLIAISSEPIVAAAVEPRLPCVNCPAWDSLALESFQLNSPTNLTLTIKNTGMLTVGLANYKVQDSQGNQWGRTWWWEPNIYPNSTAIVMIIVGAACGNCTYAGTTGSFTQFNTGSSYTVMVTTARNFLVSFSVKT